MDPAQRAERQRQRIRERKRTQKPYPLYTAYVTIPASLRASEGMASWQRRRGCLVRDVQAAVRFEPDEFDLLAGKLLVEPEPVTEAMQAEATAYLAQYPVAPGQGGHCELDLEPLFDLGIDGLLQRIARHEEQAQGDTRDVYRSFLDVLNGLSQLLENAGRAMAEKEREAAPAFRPQLAAAAAACRRVSHEPPQSFLEAIQLLWFSIFAAMFADGAGLTVPGHLDRSLAPFYFRDLDAGTLTRGQALALVEELYFLVNDHVHDGLAMSVMVGGRDAAGNDVTNELSYICLEALRRTRLIYPTVGVCWHEGTPPSLVDLAVDIIAEGIPTPAFFGDETIQRGLRALGLPPEESCHYINSTCVEITPSGSSGVWVASPYFNLCGHLLEEMAAQCAAGSPAHDLDSFLDAYLARLAGVIEAAVCEQNDWRRQRQAIGRRPLQSVFTRDCIERGRDIDDGGARYNWVECSFVGLANLVDSLHVLREEVFERGRLTMAQLKHATESDFDGEELLRRRLLDTHAKYGHDQPEVDELFARIVDFLREECAKHRMAPDNSAFVPGAFCWIMHEALGHATAATPDGRRAGMPFADGCGPAQGREKHGPTAAILSTTSWDHSPMIGGLAYNMKFNSRLFEGARGREGLRDLILTYLRRGGFETQVNVVDTETLKRAVAEPEAYSDLIVRIGGYADYFTRLSANMQQELILRTEFEHV